MKDEKCKTKGKEATKGCAPEQGQTKSTSAKPHDKSCGCGCGTKK